MIRDGCQDRHTKLKIRKPNGQSLELDWLKYYVVIKRRVVKDWLMACKELHPILSGKKIRLQIDMIPTLWEKSIIHFLKD